MLIDLDHVPQYVGWHVLRAAPSGRPLTHSLLTVGVLLVLAAGSRRLRLPFLGMAFGVALHLLRDASEGRAGVPLLWPMHRSFVEPQWWFVVEIGVLAAAALLPRRVQVASANDVDVTTERADLRHMIETLWQCGVDAHTDHPELRA